MKTLRNGFTLIELLVVTAIISIVASITIPQFAAYRASRFDRRASGNCLTAARAQDVYFLDNGRYAATTGELVPYGLEMLPDIEIMVITIGNGEDFELECSSPKGTSGSKYVWKNTPKDGEPNMTRAYDFH